MFNNDLSQTNSNNQVVLSYELLCLLQWLAQNESDTFKQMINRSLKAGLKEYTNETKNMSDDEMLDDMQESIVDFLGLLEDLLLETANEHAVKKARERNLLPEIDHIDGTLCDATTVRHSIEEAATKIEKNPKVNPREALFKELLKRWKPNKKAGIN
jgi:hypothetical protein